MPILCLGLSHQTAPVALREQIAYRETDCRETLQRFVHGEEAWTKAFAELVILSTCNRVELYALTTESKEMAFEQLLTCLSETCGVARSDIQSHLYHYEDQTAWQHLCRTTAGLESIVLGESQILGQVANAQAMAQEQHASQKVLGELFRAAMRAGKRARHETGIDRNPASVGSMAVHLAQAIVSDLRQAQVLIVGAGEMAELTLEALSKRGVASESITITNRTKARAVDLAKKWGGSVHDFADLPQALTQADIVITSTGASHSIIQADMLNTYQREEYPLVLIDIAVPRDVHPQVAQLPNVYLFDIDTLQTHLAEALAKRQAEVPKVEAIIVEEVVKFEAWLRESQVIPLIKDLRHHAETIRQDQLKRALKHLPNLDHETNKQLQYFSRALVNQLLHEPTQRLRLEASNEQGTVYAETVRHLFGLTTETSPTIHSQ